MPHKDQPKHAKIRTFIPNEDGSADLITKSYHEKLSGIKEEKLHHFKTSRQTLLADIIDCLLPISEKETKELTLLIETDDFYHPRLITRTYTTKVEKFNPR